MRPLRSPMPCRAPDPDGRSEPAGPSGTALRPRRSECSARPGRSLQRIGAEIEVDLADRQQNAVVHLRPARHDGDVEAEAAVCAVGQRLVEAAVLGFGDPVGGERPTLAAARWPRRRRSCSPGERRGDYDTGGKPGAGTGACGFATSSHPLESPLSVDQAPARLREHGRKGE